MRLAYELCKTEYEILEMTPDEYARWVAFFQLLADDDKRRSRNRGNGKFRKK